MEERLDDAEDDDEDDDDRRGEEEEEEEEEGGGCDDDDVCDDDGPPMANVSGNASCIAMKGFVDVIICVVSQQQPTPNSTAYNKYNKRVVPHSGLKKKELVTCSSPFLCTNAKTRFLVFQTLSTFIVIFFRCVRSCG